VRGRRAHHFPAATSFIVAISISRSHQPIADRLVEAGPPCRALLQPVNIAGQDGAEPLAPGVGGLRAADVSLRRHQHRHRHRHPVAVHFSKDRRRVEILGVGQAGLT